MSKRELSLYEIVDKNGNTAGWSSTVPQAKKMQNACGPGTFFRPKVVPIRPDQLAAFMTVQLVLARTLAGAA